MLGETWKTDPGTTSLLSYLTRHSLQVGIVSQDGHNKGKKRAVVKHFAQGACHARPSCLLPSLRSLQFSQETCIILPIDRI